jgi:hypothetical protein
MHFAVLEMRQDRMNGFVVNVQRRAHLNLPVVENEPAPGHQVPVSLHIQPR